MKRMWMWIFLAIAGTGLFLAAWRTSRAGYESAPYQVVREDGDRLLGAGRARLRSGRLFHCLDELGALGLPLYVSLSRKDFIGAVLAGSWEERLPAGERVMHTIMAIVYGAFLAHLLPQVLQWLSQP